MIHYHGTPIGGKSTDAGEILRGRHGLVSFANQQHLPIVLDVCQSFVLDNGAFTKWKKDGGMVDFDAYAAWVGLYHKHPGFDWCLIPDTIDGVEIINKTLTQRWLVEYGHIKGVPVWHLHESFDYLDYLLSSFDIVALGSSGEWPNPRANKWWDRMEEVMEVCCDSKGRPRAKLHGLRMLDPRVFTKLPLSSADSTNAGRNNNQMNRFGSYPHPSAGHRAATIAARIESFNSAPVWARDKQEEMFL